MLPPDPLHLEDPWYDELASGRPAGAGETGAASPAPDPGGTPPGISRRNDHSPPPASRRAAYLAVHRSAEFQLVRRRHRRFVLPAAGAFLGCHLGWLVLAVGAPGWMSLRPGGGPFTVALLTGAGQFAVVAVLTWAYVRHARLYRDPVALEVRWRTGQLTRSVPGGRGAPW